MDEEGVSLKDALRIVYGSALYKKLQNVKTDLYREGPAYPPEIVQLPTCAKGEMMISFVTNVA